MWAISAVFQASIVGVQKTRDSARRILCQLEEDLDRRALISTLLARLVAGGISTTQFELKLDTQIREDLVAPLKDQIDHGAVPNYRPDRWSRTTVDLQMRSSWTLDLIALAIVATGSLGGVWLAARVPPEGWNCRTGVKVVMFLHYLFSGVVQLLVNRLPVSTWPKVYATAILDLLVLLSFTGIIFTTQVGVLNRVGCYMQEISKGVWGVVLPSFTWETVRERMHLEYPVILFGFLGLQILICLSIWVGFREARQVYGQDDTESQTKSSHPSTGCALVGRAIKSKLSILASRRNTEALELPILHQDNNRPTGAQQPLLDQHSADPAREDLPRIVGGRRSSCSSEASQRVCRGGDGQLAAVLC